MKSYKLLAVALLAAMASSAAYSQTVIRFTGSSAFRASTAKAIENSLNPGFTVAANGTTTQGSNIVTYVGTTLSGNNSVIIQTSFTGSVDGIRDITTGVANTYIVPSLATATAVTGLTAVSTSIPANVETGVADVALADNLQSSTSFKTPTLAQTAVGIVPFVFVKGRLDAAHTQKAAWDALTNISPAGARSLFNNGTNLSILNGLADPAWTTYSNNGTFTGVDTRFKVYALGRNPFSGTRVVTFAETGYGTSAAAFQYKAYRSGDSLAASSIPTVGAGDIITTVRQYPAQTVSGQFFARGNNGFGSGGTLATELSATVGASALDANSQPFGLVGYVGTSDAATFLKNVFGATATKTASETAAHILTYNGVSLPVTLTGGTVAWDYSAVQEGRYTLFGNEYISYITSTIGAVGTVKRDFADAVGTEIKNNTVTLAGVSLASMKVNRASEGAAITSK